MEQQKHLRESCQAPDTPQPGAIPAAATREMPQCTKGIGEFCPFFSTSVLVFILFFGHNESLFFPFVFDFHPLLGVLGGSGFPGWGAWTHLGHF